MKPGNRTQDQSSPTCVLQQAATTLLLLVPFCGLGCRPLFGSPMTVSPGVVGVARTEAGLGVGWSLSIGAEVPEAGMILQLDYARTEYDDARVSRVTGEMIHLMSGYGNKGWLMQLGWAGNWSDGDAWGTGPAAGVGLYYSPKRDLGLLILASAYVWLGSSNDDFDAGVEGSLLARMAFSF